MSILDLPRPPSQIPASRVRTHVCQDDDALPPPSYYEKNREAILARLKTPEARAKAAAWRQANKDRLNARDRHRYQKHGKPGRVKAAKP